MKVKTNEIYQLGEHILACGNINDKNLLKKLIGESRIDCILQDPPFGIAVVESIDKLLMADFLNGERAPKKEKLAGI